LYLGLSLRSLRLCERKRAAERQPHNSEPHQWMAEHGPLLLERSDDTEDALGEERFRDVPNFPGSAAEHGRERRRGQELRNEIASRYIDEYCMLDRRHTACAAAANAESRTAAIGRRVCRFNGARLRRQERGEATRVRHQKGDDRDEQCPAHRSIVPHPSAPRVTLAPTHSCPLHARHHRAPVAASHRHQQLSRCATSVIGLDVAARERSRPTSFIASITSGWTRGLESTRIDRAADAKQFLAEAGIHDEIGMGFLAPGGGHGTASSINLSDVEVSAKPVPQ